eukprot:128659-Rhodomonas_salina.1
MSLWRIPEALASYTLALEASPQAQAHLDRANLHAVLASPQGFSVDFSRPEVLLFSERCVRSEGVESQRVGS